MNSLHRMSSFAIGIGLFTLLATAALAAAPSMKPGMPREILSWRDEILSKDEYRRLVDEWRSYIDRHPQEAAAYVQLARAMRYARTGSAEDRNDQVRKALAIDPDCPEALDAYADTGLHSSDPMLTREEALEYAERASRLAPEWTYPHFTLWSLLISLGREDEAVDELRTLTRKGGFPSPLMDFNYDILVSAEPGAIILTNGDNDTYPSLALQAAHGIRRDVAIVNLSLLNLIEYAVPVWKRTFGNDGPFTDRELRKMHEGWKDEHKSSGDLFATQVLKALLEKVRTGKWHRPVYFAITVAPTHLDACDRQLEIEGLLLRVTRAPKRADGEHSVNLDKTLRLFREEFRLESATDLAYPWTPDSAIRPLMTNYPAVLRLVAARSADGGDLESARYALREAMEVLEFHDYREMMGKMAEYWKELDPRNPEIDRWR